MNNAWYLALMLFIALLFTIIVAATAFADQPPALPIVRICPMRSGASCSGYIKSLKLCDEAIEACENVIKEEDASVIAMKAQVSKLDDALVTEQNSDKRTDIMYFILGLGAGVLTSYTILHH